MITREQSDKICDSIINEVMNRFVKPIQGIGDAMNGIITREKFDKSIERKCTYNIYHNYSFMDVKGSVGVSNVRREKDRIEFHVSKFRERTCNEKISLGLFYKLDDLYKIIFTIMPIRYCSDYFRSLLYYGKDGDDTIRCYNLLRDSVYEYLTGDNVKINLSDLDEAYTKFDSICDFAKKEVEAFSGLITKAYNLAMEKDREDDAMVLSRFGLTPEAVEPESFEIKIEVIKVNRGKKSTKKGKK